MASEKTPLMGGSTPPSNAIGDKSTVYFLERQKSIDSRQVSIAISQAAVDAEEIETLPEGSVPDQFTPRPVSAGSLRSSSRAAKGPAGWLEFFKNVGKKSNAFAAMGGAGGGVGGGGGIDAFPRKAPVKIDPKVFFANERTFLAWMHVSVILAGASVAIVAFSDSRQHSVANQLYGIVLLPVSISFIIYAMMQYSRRASMIRRKAPGPYVDITGPTVLTVILMLSIVTQFSIKLYTLM
ncbi:hypothetical protein ACHAW5_008473 [Stephanodiscus triporus]|uniref:DUF202 domain-containing protein n=1 Tax=Stephanodiscus triporus TaxID=2934178 RepID=A0ABD3MRJ7_9STRA